MVVLFIVMILSSISVRINGAENPQICVTQSCNDTASRILKNMDDKVNPCDDFYQFACGNFIKNTVIPDENTRINSISIVEDKIRGQLRDSLEEFSNFEDPKSLQLVKNLYSSCMNKTRIEERGLDPLNQILEKLGGWPVLLGDKWSESDFNWIESAYKFRKFGFNHHHFFSMFVTNDPKNNTFHVIDLRNTYHDLCPKYLIQGRGNEKVEAYYSYMVDIAKILGADQTEASKELAESLEFEIKLAKISREENQTSMTVKDLRQMYPSIPWVEYLNNIINASPNITDDEVVVVQVPSLLSEVKKLLEETPKRVQANYIMWRAIYFSVTYLNDELKERQLIYNNAINGETKKPRWAQCVDMTSNWLWTSISSLYVKKHFKSDKNNSRQMVNNIKKQFKEILEKVDWMDEKTRKAALMKIDSMEEYIAYPDELLNDTKLENYYKNLKINPAYYYESILNIKIFIWDGWFSKLRQPFHKNDWIDRSYSIGARTCYNQRDNSIAGILQEPYFSNDLPKYLNYGAFGTHIGHLIIHGFDDYGKNYDQDGRLNEWWHPSTKKNYQNLSQCFINQYSNYTIPEINLKLSGVDTKNENIAENGGVKVAYNAYNKWADQNKPEPKLLGLEKYTPQQMFWISTASLSCEKRRKEVLKLDFEDYKQSPSQFRILGTLSNMPQFSKDFNCKPGSKMNPENKCAIW